MAACGVAALGYFQECLPEYESASLHDTLRLYAEKERLRMLLEARPELEATPTVVAPLTACVTHTCPRCGCCFAEPDHVG